MQIALDMAVDLDQALGRDRADDLQPVGNDGAATPEQTEHGFPLLRIRLSSHERENRDVASEFRGARGN